MCLRNPESRIPGEGGWSPLHPGVFSGPSSLVFSSAPGNRGKLASLLAKQMSSWGTERRSPLPEGTSHLYRNPLAGGGGPGGSVRPRDWSPGPRPSAPAPAARAPQPAPLSWVAVAGGAPGSAGQTGAEVVCVGGGAVL